MPIEVTDDTFDQEVLQAAGPVLADFWAEWCGPCRMIAPVLEELSRELAGQLTVAKLNVDENPHITARYNVMSIPTLLLFKDGELKERLIGYMPKAKLEEKIRPYLS